MLATVAELSADQARSSELLPDPIQGPADVRSAPEAVSYRGSSAQPELFEAASSDGTLGCGHAGLPPRSRRPHDIPIEEPADYVGPPLATGQDGPGGTTAA